MITPDVMTDAERSPRSHALPNLPERCSQKRLDPIDLPDRVADDIFGSDPKKPFPTERARQIGKEVPGDPRQNADKKNGSEEPFGMIPPAEKLESRPPLSR
jgi:hypothetical protein